MKTISLIVLFLSCFIFVKAEDKCDMSNFNECISSINGLLLGLGAKTAESQCPTDKCKKVRSDWADCLEKVYSAQEYSDQLTKTLVSAVGLLTIRNSIICEKEGNKYCYDVYNTAKKNQTLLNEFYCSKCGKRMQERYKTVLKTLADKNAGNYEEIQKEIDEVNMCSGAFIITALKLATFLIIGLASYLLL